MLGACSNQPPAPAEAGGSQAQVPAQPPLSKAERRERQIEHLLDRAELALSRDRLLMPAHDNAYDRYASVLVLEPGNEAARLGLQAIVLRYLDMARDAAQRSRFAEAETYLDRAAGILPQDEGVQSLIQQQREAIARPQERPAADNVTLLDARALGSRSDGIKTELVQLARRAKQTDHMVLIVAASDAQGRWIYQTMREAVKGYLLRGDIQVGSPARIEFLPPLEE